MMLRKLISLIFFTYMMIPMLSLGAFNDSGWVQLYQENFDGNYTASHGQTFGTDNWLAYQLINGGAIEVANGYAQLNAPDFQNAALIRSSAILPDEYKIRTKVGYINYDLDNYEQADYDHPDFDTHGGNYENGIYFLTVTDDTCSGNQCAEPWWHRHRKMVIDVDNHIRALSGEITFHPVYMVYMSPDTNFDGNLLRTWKGNIWDESDWNWNVAYTYEYDSWYYAELEKWDGHLILRLYDADQNIIEETTPVGLDLIYAMDNPIEYLYVGEPHTDDYEGDARIDEITLLVVDNSVDIASEVSADILPERFQLYQNFPNPFNPITRIDYAIPLKNNIRITVYNLLGQEVRVLVDGEKNAGRYSISWDGTDFRDTEVATGIYFYQIEAGDYKATRKMLLLR